MKVESTAVPPMLQGFRVGNSDILNLRPRRDKDGNIIILWRDILQAFGDVKHIRDGPTVVSFLTDDNFEYLEPLRIGFCPGVVLDVVMQDDDVESLVAESEALGSTSTLETAADVVPSSLLEAYSEMGISDSTRSPTPMTMVPQQTELGLYPPFSASQSMAYNHLVPQESFHQASTYAHLAGSNQPTTHTYMTLGGPSLSFIGNHVPLASPVQPSTNTDMSPSGPSLSFIGSHVPLAGPSQPSINMPPSGPSPPSSFGHHPRAPCIIEDQQQSRDGRTSGGSELQQPQQPAGVMVDQQTTENLTIIRSRIHAVLAKTYGLRDSPIPRLFIALPKRYRINPQTQKVTLDGFRLFFLCECDSHTKIRTSIGQHEIHLVKHHGYDVKQPTELFTNFGKQILAVLKMVKHRINVPCKNGLLSIAHQEVMELLGKLCSAYGPLTRSAEALLDDTIELLQDHLKNTGAASDERLDPGRLQSFIDIVDGDLGFGNLYRTVTDIDNVKWVCSDHYRKLYPLSLEQQLGAIEGFKDATVVEELGSVGVRIMNRKDADDVYEALSKARGLQELKIFLGWDLHMNDLGELALSMTSTTIHRLILHGSQLKMSKTDWETEIPEIPETVYWFEPIVFALPSRDHLQARAEGEDNPLSMLWEAYLIDQPSFENGGSLMFMQLDILKAALRPMLMGLQSLTIRREAYTLHVSLSNGDMAGIDAEIHSLDGITELDKLLLLEGYLTSLLIKTTPSVDQEPLLKDLIRQNPKLTRVSIGSHALRALRMIDVVLSSSREAIGRDSSPTRRMLEIHQDDGTEGKSIEGLHGSITCTADFTAVTVPDMSIHVTTRQENSSVFTDVFERFGWLIVSLDLSAIFTDEMALALDKATRWREPKLSSLILDTRSLSLTGMYYVTQVIQRSRLSRLGVCIDGLESEENQERADKMLRTLTKKLNFLRLSGSAPHAWIPTIKDTIETRAGLPQLDTLELVHEALTIACRPYAQWIAAMVSAAPKDPTMGVESAWTPLKCIRLENISCEPEDWATIIKAIDISCLETLSFENSNLDVQSLPALMDQLLVNGQEPHKIPLKVLNLRGALPSMSKSVDELGVVMRFSLKLYRTLGLTVLGLDSFTKHFEKQE